MTRKAFANVSVAVVPLVFLAGCKVDQRLHTFETGYHNAGKVQVQFYAPPGATVTVGNVLGVRSHQVNTYGDGTHKLELEPEQFATFNLSPGRYEFKYDGAGWSDATLYGELEVRNVWPWTARNVKKMLARSFIPVALPGPGTVKAVSTSDDLFPYQSSAHRLKISHQDVERLAAGDTLTKVVFVADLKKAAEASDNLEVELVNMRGRRRRLQAMLHEAQLDQIDNPSSKKFIRLQTEIAKLDQDIQEREDKNDRLDALLRADKVLIRREMLVMATDELLAKHEG